MSFLINPYIAHVPTQVTFQEAGTGSALASVGNLTPSFPVTGLAANDLFILQVGIKNAAVAINTPSGWTAITEAKDVNSAALALHMLFYKVATGSESGNQTVTFTTDVTDVKMARIYRFRGGAVSELFGTKVTTAGTGSATLSAPTVVCTAKSLACCFTYEADNNTFPAFTGETGGDWDLPVAIFTTPLGSDSTIALHTATMDTAGTITGGSTTMQASATWGNLSFALKGTSFLSAPTSYSGYLYGIGGQSNANGEAAVASISGRPELLEVIPRSYIWWEGVNGVGWQPLQAGVNGNTDISKFGPIISFAYAEHVKYPNVDKFYVIHAVGGSSMATWVSSLINFFKAKYNAATANLTETAFKTYSWIHGETDAANDAASTAYEGNEDTFMTDIFASTSFTSASVVQLHESLPAGVYLYDQRIRDAKTANHSGGNYGATGSLVSVTGLTLAGDNIHYNAAGLIGLGENISDQYE